MYHTVYLYKQMNGRAYNLLFNALKNCSNDKGVRFFKRAIGSSFECDLFKERGMIIYLEHDTFKANRNEVHYHAIGIRLNPKRLIKKHEYIEVTKFSDYPEVTEAFREAFAGVKVSFLSLETTSPVVFNFDKLSTYKVKRIDYCINVQIQGAREYMELIRRADKPKSFEIVEKYDPISKRKKAFSNAYYVKNKSVCINFYDKSFQMAQVLDEYKQHPTPRDILRFEVQCKKPKVNNIVQKNNIQKSLYKLSDPQTSMENLLYYYEKTVGLEGYYSIKKAKSIIEKSNHRKKYKERLVEVLKYIARKRSVWKARENCLQGKKSFDTAVKDLKKLGINPVTIPDNWKVPSLPNLIHEIVKEFIAPN